MVNRVIERRMTKKKQQMRWSRRSAHLLVQVRLAVLEGGLQDALRRGYPRFPMPVGREANPRLTTLGFFPLSRRWRPSAPPMRKATSATAAIVVHPPEKRCKTAHPRFFPVPRNRLFPLSNGLVTGVVG